MRLSCIARGIRRVTVEGASMAPTLAPGDRLLVFPVLRLRPGDIVAVADPRQPRRLLVKRVVSLDARDRAISVEGDNVLASTDSRTFGPVARKAVMGRAIYRYAPKGRAGRLPRVRRPAGGTVPDAR